MIVERFPGIEKLSVEEKRQLVHELWKDLLQSGEEEPDPAIVQLLEQRWRHYQQNPDSAVSLEEFRRRIGIA